MNKKPVRWMLMLSAVLILTSCGGYTKIGRIHGGSVAVS
jgi:hypothetical protein